MQEYDIALKLLLRNSAPVTVRELTGTAIEKWLDVELPKVQKAHNPRLDLLGRAVDGQLIHVELQSGNDAEMPFRMIEYCLGVQRMCGQFPRQILLYVGEAPMRMESRLAGPDLSFQYSLIDIRTINGERLLESHRVGDNVIAILTRLRDDKEAVRQIVQRIAGLAGTERDTALAQLMILAGLRHLAGNVEEEARKMPIDLDIRDHEVIGPLILEAEQKGLRAGRQEGRKKGREEGRQEGRQEGLLAGEMTVLRRLIEKRFGALPAWAAEKLEQMQARALENLSERVLDAKDLRELLK